MKKHGEKQGSYVRKVHDETQRFAQSLIADNQKLRALVSDLESQKQRLDEEAQRAAGALGITEELRALAASLENEKRLLEERLGVLRDDLDRHQAEKARLQRQLADIGDEGRKLTEQYVAVEKHSTNLANLYVASYSLHGTLDREEVLTAIKEILANLVGSEEVGVFELDREANALKIVASFGIEPAAYQMIALGSGLIGRAAQTAEMYISGESDGFGRLPEEADLTVCVPLMLDERVTGAIAIFRLLPQKLGLEPVDRELFELLATHAATALYCTGLHARQGSVEVTG